MFLLELDGNRVRIAIAGTKRRGYRHTGVRIVFRNRRVDKPRNKVGLASDFESYSDTLEYNRIGKRTDPGHVQTGKRNPLRQPL